MAGFLRSPEDFVLPTDSEHKAKRLRPWVPGGVHMLAFHLSWMSMFSTTFSFMAPVSLLPVVREDLDLTDSNIEMAGVAAMSGVVFARIVTGVLCDLIGPRLSHAGVLLLTAPVILATGLVTDAVGFIACRFLIGFSLAAFVACQYWCSVMFNVKIVGRANAMAAGWGSTGSWASLILMPVIFECAKKSIDTFAAWRYMMWVPGILQMIVGFSVLTWAQDMPDGSYQLLRKNLEISRPRGFKLLWTGISNHRLWLLLWVCSFSSGVELTMQNILIPYLTDQFSISMYNAGILVCILLPLNALSRMLGGYISDVIGSTSGMRGRLTVLWLSQSVAGILVVLLGLSYASFPLTVILLGALSVFVMAAQGATFGIVPFVSKRALGVVNGFVGAGGNVGSALLQVMLFSGGTLSTSTGIMIMGAVAFLMTQPVLLLSFPQWGGIFTMPQGGVLEEEYYLEEYSVDEISSGEAHASLIFAVEARSQR